MALGKAKVEVAVQIIERWIVAALRQPAVFPAGRSEPRDPGTAGAVEPAAVPQARRSRAKQWSITVSTMQTA